MNKKNRNIWLGVIFTIAILLLALNANKGFLASGVPSGTYIQAPTFYYYECNAGSQPVESNHSTLATGSSEGWITIPSNTDTADLWISQIEKAKWFATDRSIVYQICHNNGANCDPQVRTPANSFLSKNSVPSVHISNLLTTDRVFVNYQYRNLLGQWKDQSSGAEWYHTYKPFILWKVDMFGGGRNEYTSVEQGCSFPSGSISNLIDSITNINKQINSQSSTSDTSLPFYKTRNFIGTYVPIATANVNFVDYNGQKGYCLQRQIFAITTVETNGGTYQIVDNNFNTRLANSVDCCPGESEPTRKCSSNFKWENIEVAQCSAFNACQGANWMPSGSKNLIRYNCINSKCVPETKAVQCTSNADCGIQQQCDTYSYTCVGVASGTIKCLNNQTLVNGKCVDNQANACAFYQEPFTTENKDYGLLGWRHLTGNPVTTTTSGCKTSGITYIIVLGVFIVILISIIYYFKRKR